MPITHEISSLVNGPDTSGVSIDWNCGRNWTGQHKAQPFASWRKLAAENEKADNQLPRRKIRIDLLMNLPVTTAKYWFRTLVNWNVWFTVSSFFDICFVIVRDWSSERSKVKHPSKWESLRFIVIRWISLVRRNIFFNFNFCIIVSFVCIINYQIIEK